MLQCFPRQEGTKTSLKHEKRQPPVPGCEFFQILSNGDWNSILHPGKHEAPPRMACFDFPGNNSVVGELHVTSFVDTQVEWLFDLFRLCHQVITWCTLYSTFLSSLTRLLYLKFGCWFLLFPALHCMGSVSAFHATFKAMHPAFDMPGRDGCISPTRLLAVSESLMSIWS